MLFFTTLQQVTILLILILIGYFFSKKGIITGQGKKVLAGLLVNLFTPAYSIISLSTRINVYEIKKYALILLAGAVFAVISVLLAIPFAKVLGKEKFHKNLYKYAFAFGNFGYFGYPLLDAVFGLEAKAQMILFCIPLELAVVSYGYYILTEPFGMERQPLSEKSSFKISLKRLFGVPMCASLIGIALGLLSSGLGFAIPSFLNDLCTILGNCRSAPAMLITGAAVASVSFGKLFTSIKAYIISVVRLLILPLICSCLVAIVYLLGWRDADFMRIAFFVIVCSAMPIGMNVVVFPESVGMDATEGAKTCFISYVLALVTLPVIFSVLMKVLTVTF